MALILLAEVPANCPTVADFCKEYLRRYSEPSAFASASLSFSGPTVLPRPAAPAAAPVASVPAAATVTREIPCISLQNSGLWNGNSKFLSWRSNFDYPMTTEADVKPGSFGSIGIDYDMGESLAKTFKDSPSHEDKINAMLAKTTGSGGFTRVTAKVNVNFYEFAQQDKQPYFVIKKGLTGLWLAKKTSGHYWIDPETPGRRIFQNRFRFEIVRNLTADEADMNFGSRLATIKYKNINIPA
jgi:hypothetical protein